MGRSLEAGQGFIEYAVLLTAVIAALVTMQIYLKRSLSGSYRAVAQSLGASYAPTHASANVTITASGRTVTTSTLLKDQTLTVANNTVTADLMQTVTTIDPSNPERSVVSGVETIDAPTGTNLWSN